MKVLIDEDEWYPVYSADDATSDGAFGYKEAEMMDAEWSDYQRVIKEFEAWQAKLRVLYDNGKERD